MRGWTRGDVRAKRIGQLGRAFTECKNGFVLPTGTVFSLKMVDEEACRIWAETWQAIERSEPDGGWDWAHIHNETKWRDDQFCIALWHDDAILCGLALLTVTRGAIAVEVLEGNPDRNHPLKRSVLPILLDTSTRFAQVVGRSELRLVEPVDGLISVYCDVYGFELVPASKGQKTVCRRSV